MMKQRLFVVYLRTTFFNGKMLECVGGDQGENVNPLKMVFLLDNYPNVELVYNYSVI